MPAKPDPERIPVVMRTAHVVRSMQSGAIIVGPVSRQQARDEADRLNAEASKVTAAPGGGIVFASMQCGERTRYYVDTITVRDEDARLDALRSEIARLETGIATAKGAQRDALLAELQVYRADLGDGEG